MTTDDAKADVPERRAPVRAAYRPRQAWEEKFETMANQGDDVLLDGDVLTFTTWDEDEWEW